MATIRRVYIYLVCAITLQAFGWATINLVWSVDPFGPRAPVAMIALEIAMIVVALPLYLAHWLWAQRLAVSEEERGDVWRRIYLYGMLGIFLFAFTVQVVNLISALAHVGLGTVLRGVYGQTVNPAEMIADSIAGIILFGLLGLYQRGTLYRDEQSVSVTGSSATVRRLYVLTFSAVGLVMSVISSIQTLRWVLLQIASRLVVRDVTIEDEVSRLLVGVALWLVFWLMAQNLFNGSSEPERESALRKFYLYLTVSLASAGAVLGAAFLLDEIIREGLGLAPSGDIRNPVSVMIVTTVLWAYHYVVLRGDASRVREMPRQAGIRRLYLYLIAGIGLAAFLGGLIGEGNLVIRALAGESFGSGLKELLAWATSALVAGLPVWLLPWRRLQNGAVTPGPAGTEERRSVVRKLYLYAYLLLATLTVLASTVYILSQFVTIALGGRASASLVTDLSQAMGFAVIGIAVWFYHGYVLRGDGRMARQEQDERLGSMSIAVVDAADGRWGSAAVNALKREWPALKVQPVGLSPAASGVMGIPWDQSALAAPLRSANVIVGSWTMAAANGQVSPEIAQVIAASPARKLNVPTWGEGWEWVGIERLDDEALVREAVRAVKQILEGEEVKPARSAILTAVFVVVAACVVLSVISMLPRLLGGILR